MYCLLHLIAKTSNDVSLCDILMMHSIPFDSFSFIFQYNHVQYLVVRRLDVMQIRAQEALAVTEDVINIKDNKSKMKSAIENGDLPSAVNFIREVHEIGLDSAGKNSIFLLHVFVVDILICTSLHLTSPHFTSCICFSLKVPPMILQTS